MPETTAQINLQEIRNLYFYLGQITTIAAEQRKQLQPMILSLMGDKKELVTPDGWIFVREERISREYDKAALRLIFDTDQLDVVMKPDGRAVKALAKEIGLTKDQLTALDKATVVTGTTEALKLMPPNKETMGGLRK